MGNKSSDKQDNPWKYEKDYAGRWMKLIFIFGAIGVYILTKVQ